MASRTNKYASLNFNNIYEKKKIINPSNNRSHASSSASSSLPSFSSSLTGTGKTVISNSRIHGNMLVLSRPSPKPIVPQSQPPQAPPQLQHSIQDQTRLESESISLRPLGRAGSGPSLAVSPLVSLKPDKDLTPPMSPLPSPKTDRFVPPHLRPGFVGREEKPSPEIQKQPGVRPRELGGQRQGHYGSPNRYSDDGRPKSGGGYEKMRRGGESDLVKMKRPGSSGTRPSSSG